MSSILANSSCAQTKEFCEYGKKGVHQIHLFARFLVLEKVSYNTSPEHCCGVRGTYIHGTLKLMDNHPMATVNSRINSLENTDRKTMILWWSCFVKVPSVTIDITAPFVARLFCFCDIYRFRNWPSGCAHDVLGTLW